MYFALRFLVFLLSKVEKIDIFEQFLVDYEEIKDIKHFETTRSYYEIRTWEDLRRAVV